MTHFRNMTHFVSPAGNPVLFFSPFCQDGFKLMKCSIHQIFWRTKWVFSSTRFNTTSTLKFWSVRGRCWWRRLTQQKTWTSSSQLIYNSSTSWLTAVSWLTRCGTTSKGLDQFLTRLFDLKLVWHGSSLHFTFLCLFSHFKRRSFWNRNMKVTPEPFSKGRRNEIICPTRTRLRKTSVGGITTTCYWNTR